jgi:hypothetical protein
MSTTELRREIKRKVNALPEDRLQSAADFLAFLEAGTESDAESRRLRGFRNRLQKAEAEVASGRVVPVSRLRRKL